MKNIRKQSMNGDIIKRQKTTNKTNHFIVAAYVAVAIVGIDFMGLLAFALMGQTPADNFFLGTISAHIIQIIA